jgi:arylsulfatase A-like enzyme
MLEAMDSEMGRLLSSMTQEEKDNTVIIFIGDNGTPNQVVQVYNSNRAKGSVYQGGVNVPMVVSGLDVNRINDTEDALVHTVDLFATISEITGAGSSSINDSQSFAPLLTDANAAKRDYVYTEIGKDTGGFDYTIRNGTHKYILFDDGSEALYNLVNNPLENPNLLNPSQLPLSDVDSAIKDELTTKVTEIRQ